MAGRRVEAVNGNRDAARKTPAPQKLVLRLQRIAQQIPRKELDRLPADLIENLDHYLYGTPKR